MSAQPADLARQPWEPIPGESGKAHNAFRLWSQNPAGWTKQDLAKEIGVDRNTVAGWMKRWAWQARYDAREAAAVRGAIQAAGEDVVAKHQLELRQMRERHAQMAVTLQAKALEALRGFQPSDLSPHDALRFLIEAAKLERLSRGEPDQVVEQRHSGEVVTEQRVVLALLADPEARQAAVIMAAKAAALPAASNGHG